MCALDGDDNLMHTLSLRDAGTCATRSLSLCLPHPSFILGCAPFYQDGVLSFEHGV